MFILVHAKLTKQEVYFEGHTGNVVQSMFSQKNKIKLNTKLQYRDMISLFYCSLVYSI